ncbi:MULTISPECIES: YutD family protein [unclassified Paenibacillus]|uniref:YutD family protein n=1 Tax=unclassified Paenibacillus TaxID=185978 RepID=UPI00203D73D4|nr:MULTISPECIES: YutD family protein [unclassified Paenibacillus]MCM3175876.1 YutD family protein [Paenibacillus sp. MER 99-2]
MMDDIEVQEGSIEQVQDTVQDKPEDNAQQNSQDKPQEKIIVQVGGKNYEIVQNHKEGWNAEVFRDRYSEVLERYDYIIGDWGYSQLRLKGFYRDNHPKATKDSTIASLVDYINEYCNFGCAYFVLQKSKEQPPAKAKSGS